MLTNILTMLYSRSSGLIHSIVKSLYLFTSVSLFSHPLAPGGFDAGRDWVQEEKGTTEDEMAGWHH